MTKNKYGRVFVECICECGNEKTYDLHAIKSGHTKSCGCSKFNNPLIMEDLTGKTFNRLTVIKRDTERDSKRHKSGNAHWICRCICGNISSVVGYRLKNGLTKSCGCLSSEITAERNRRDSSKINRVFPTKENSFESTENVVKVYSDDGLDFFIVDLDDYEYIKNWFWRKDKKGYWVTNAKKGDDEKFHKATLRVHQMVAMRKYGEYDTRKLFPDHLSRDKSDNRRCNLVLKSNAENMRNRSLSKSNTSGKTGVSFANGKSVWTAYITVNYKNIHLGDFKNYEDAVKARIEAEEKYGFTCDENTSEYDNVS